MRSCLGVPQAHGAIATARRKALAVLAEAHALDCPTVQFGKDEQLGAVRDAPDAEAAIVAAHNNPFPIGRDVKGLNATWILLIAEAQQFAVAAIEIPGELA